MHEEFRTVNCIDQNLVQNKILRQSSRFFMAIELNNKDYITKMNVCLLFQRTGRIVSALSEMFDTVVSSPNSTKVDIFFFVRFGSIQFDVHFISFFFLLKLFQTSGTLCETLGGISPVFSPFIQCGQVMSNNSIRKYIQIKHEIS